MEKKITVGGVVISPLDVVLDRDLDLGVQPDLMLISQARLGILRHRVWGAPDLVGEVVSPGSEQRDRTV